MDGIHDLGGKAGYGPLDIDPHEPMFHEVWEERVLGLFYALHQPDDWNGDWFRFCRELIAPEDYLARPYYDQWLQSLAAMLLNSGVISLDELVRGEANTELAAPPKLQSAADVSQLKSQSENFTRPAIDKPRFVESDVVQTRLCSVAHHTRLPQYIRGQSGTIRRYHGCHVLPDKNVFGEEAAGHLYLVEFKASEIWPDAGNEGDIVSLDVWEDYLEQS